MDRLSETQNFRQPHCYTIPPTTVAALVGFLKKTLGMKVIRVVGDPDMKCSRVGILVGGGSLGLGQEEMPAKLMNDQQTGCNDLWRNHRMDAERLCP